MSIAPSTDRAARSTDRPVLRVRDLEVRFAVKRDGLFSKPAQLYAVDGVSFEIASGRTLGLVGESGSGKSTTALAAARLIPARNGQVEIDGADILSLQGETLRQQRHKVQFIFQDPYSSLNPRLRASEIVREPLDRLGIDSPAERAGGCRSSSAMWACARSRSACFLISSPAASASGSASLARWPRGPSS